MADILQQLVANARTLVRRGYYDVDEQRPRSPSLLHALKAHHEFPLIAEAKQASPSSKQKSQHSSKELIQAYVRGGAAALSVLTEPNGFRGGLGQLREASESGLPVLMKDIVIEDRQLKAGERCGASAILLIERAFPSPEAHRELDRLMGRAHDLGLEVLLEVADEAEMERALEREAEMIGINQRDLRDLRMDLGKGVRMLDMFSDTDVPLIVLSGISSREQVIAVRDAGGAGVLIGTALSFSPDPEGALRALEVPR